MKLSTALTICGMLMLALVTTAFYSLSIVVHPEARLAGDWQEMAWSYEKADTLPADGGTSLFDGQLRDEIAKDLVIHRSESWSFRDDRSLVLRKDGLPPARAQWNLKGRGHVLEILYGKGGQEHYRIHELTNDRLVLHFNNDLIVRGIVRIEFRRIPDDR